MAPHTRQKTALFAEIEASKPKPYDTPKKARFFNAYDNAGPRPILTRVCDQQEIHRETGHRWLRERKEYGPDAVRKSRGRSEILGRKSRVTKAQCKFLVSKKNQLRDQLLECQIANYDIPVKKRALQAQLKKNTKNAQRYKMAYVRKVISKKNKELRVDYGHKHKDKTVEGFWSLIHFTDEFHVDPASIKTGFILREEGTRNDPDNIQEKPKKEGNKLHVAGWVNWHAKCEKLEFYNDEEDHTEQPKRPRKPIRSKYDSEEEFSERIKVWDATTPHKVEVKVKGNSMTQKYYCERLLPVYIEAIERARVREDKDWILQEDNDGSHGHKAPKRQAKSLAQTIRDDHSINLLVHPPQSPDLNPIEGCWLILKERVRKRVWHTLDELRAIIQDEWSKITMKEIQERIAEMPWRCKQAIKYGGKPIKGGKW